MKKIFEKEIPRSEVILRLEKVAERQNTTVEKLVERLEPGFVMTFGVDYYKGYVINQYECSNCRAYVGDEVVHFKFCPHCGKELINV
jgi:hypothetical protein